MPGLACYVSIVVALEKIIPAVDMVLVTLTHQNVLAILVGVAMTAILLFALGPLMSVRAVVSVKKVVSAPAKRDMLVHLAN